MYKKLVINYAKNLTIKDLDNYIKNNNIDITKQDKQTIYKHIKKYYNVFFDNPIKYIKMLKGRIDEEIYYNILMLYDKYKKLLEKDID